MIIPFLAKIKSWKAAQDQLVRERDLDRFYKQLENMSIPNKD